MKFSCIKLDYIRLRIWYLLLGKAHSIKEKEQRLIGGIMRMYCAGFDINDCPLVRD